MNIQESFTQIEICKFQILEYRKNILKYFDIYEKEFHHEIRDYSEFAWKKSEDNILISFADDLTQEPISDFLYYSFGRRFYNNELSEVFFEKKEFSLAYLSNDRYSDDFYALLNNSKKVKNE